MTTITKLSERQIQLLIGDTDQGQRIDKVISLYLDGHSRSSIQQWLKSGCVLRNQKVPRARDSVISGDEINITIPAVKPIQHQAQQMPLNIVYEDDAIIVINKPARLVVHPGAGNTHSTLLNGLLHYDPTLDLLARGGIVHRLDKDTSGLMVVARTEAARQNLVEQLSNRTVKRQYMAIVYGPLVAGGTVESPIGRHPRDRIRMAVVNNGKPAITHYRIDKKFRHTTLLRVFLETGRTHQIRVHLSSINLPLVGDPVYGKRMHFPPGANQQLKQILQNFRRQALHATELGLVHPSTGDEVSWAAPMPEDMLELADALQQDTAQS